jgi:hypothetical protein
MPAGATDGGQLASTSTGGAGISDAEAEAPR